MTECKAYPYGRFNATPTNLKLFPTVSNINLPNATKYFGSSLMVYRGANNTLIPVKGSYYRAVINGAQSRPGIATAGPIPGLSRPGNSTRILSLPLFRIFGSFVPISSTLFLTISMD